MSLETLEEIEVVETRPELERDFPVRKTKLKSSETITNKKYDLVFACPPDAQEDYSLFDEVIELINKRKLKVYSPHEDLKSKRHTLQDTVRYTVLEAIPRTKAVILHLSIVNHDLLQMVESTCNKSKPFFIMHSSKADPLSNKALDGITLDQSYRGIIRYLDNKDAIEQLNDDLNYLLT
jgi:hypothetical protein